MLGLISVWLIWLFLRYVTPQPDLWAGLRVLLNSGGGETVALGGFVPPVREPSLGWIQLAVAEMLATSAFSALWADWQGIAALAAAGSS